MLNIFYAFILMMATILLRLIMVENIQIAIVLLVYLSSLFILAMESRSLNYIHFHPKQIKRQTIITINFILKIVYRGRRVVHISDGKIIDSSIDNSVSTTSANTKNTKENSYLVSKKTLFRLGIKNLKCKKGRSVLVIIFFTPSILFFVT